MENKNQNKKEFKISNIIISIISILTILLCSLYFIFFNGGNVKQIRKSVVKINVYDKEGELLQTGSGFIAFNKNTLITNAHVVTGGHSVEAVSEEDERLYIDGVTYYSQDEDIAILKLNNQNSLRPLKITSKYNVGDKVIAIGSPLGIKNSVSDGIISNYDKSQIQHTAPISSGSSGGTLFNSKGKVIGMNTATVTAGQNINLAIPIDIIKEAYLKSKDNKVKNIKKIQYIQDEAIKSIILNNNAGKNIIDIVKKESESKNIYGCEYENSGYVDKFFLNRIVEEGYSSNWVSVSPNSGFDEDLNYYESKIPVLMIIKMNDLSNDTIQYIVDLLKEEANNQYERILNDPTDTIVFSNKDENGNLYIDDSTNYKEHIYSTEYIECFKTPIINTYNDYIYMIISSDNNLAKKIEKEIKKLP